MSENKTFNRIDAVEHLGKHISQRQDLRMFELLQKTVPNLSLGMAVVWDPLINKVCGFLIEKRNIISSAHQHAHLVKQIIFITQTVRNQPLFHTNIADIVSALSFCRTYAAAIDEEECFYDVFVWCFLMRLNEKRHEKTIHSLWRNQTFAEMCLTAAAIFQWPVAAIRPLRHEVADYMEKCNISFAETVYRICIAMRDTRLQMLDFLRGCVYEGQKHEIKTIIL